MSNINFSNTTPAAASGHINVAFANDSSNNISASIAMPLVAASNLSDVAAAATALTNLGGASLSASSNVFTGAATFATVKVGTPSSSLTANIQGAGSSGLLNICPGTIGTDPRLYIGGSTASAPDAAYFDCDAINFRNTVGTTNVASFSSSAIQFAAPITAAITGTFGGWVSWTPTVSANGSMTLSSLNVIDAQYLHLGPMVFFKLLITVTVGGTLNNAVYITTPVTPVGNVCGCGLAVGPGGSSYAPGYGLVYSGSPLGIWASPSGMANYPSGLVALLAEGFYRSA